MKEGRVSQDETKEEEMRVKLTPEHLLMDSFSGPFLLSLLSGRVVELVRLVNSGSPLRSSPFGLALSLVRLVNSGSPLRSSPFTYCLALSLLSLYLLSSSFTSSPEPID